MSIILLEGWMTEAADIIEANFQLQRPQNCQHVHEIRQPKIRCIFRQLEFSKIKKHISPLQTIKNYFFSCSFRF